ncbi:uncharacterized protein A1O9_09162 [Exophiala aquamarina CBS 119918]|uniref:Carboxymuconolactone decarboxylase-like domain-containing protein n=1 Tax=Exophiala aquamarina CBS 119918 TaxID=1182545 RepID=A0A072PGQ3_9EURO|nr:uncharacterized protein A1O9_09162 [Exophiala aquamarina CBS 119918]KEF54720.1 hypothetical protein A1O9_09162 [Exophiala aquamarina CBS 119918]
MASWDTEEFMSQWDKKYVSTNVRPGSKAYDGRFLLGLESRLASSQPELKNIANTLIVAACCAVGRADVVGRLFDDLTATATPEQSEYMFLRFREAITIIFPYLGLPTCMPACYGMIGVIQRKGAGYASTKSLRKKTITKDDVQKGTELRARVYRGVGNSEIFSLMDSYFTDLITTSTVVTWGYLIAKANEEVFQPQESHLIVATAIMALGASRQTKSHIKATLGIGNSVNGVKAVIDMVTQLAEWADRPRIGSFDVDQLGEEIKAALKG